jgi:pyruvate kinase
MLESMTDNRRPTRAESTDVANAILDGTDCVMLSGESAMGKYPVDAVAMLSKIAEAIEPHRPTHYVREALKDVDGGGKISLADLIAFSVETTLERISPAAIFVPTRSGYTARSIARFRWLAREEKIKYHTKERKTFVFLTHEEHEIFKSILEGPSPRGREGSSE